MPLIQLQTQKPNRLGRLPRSPRTIRHAVMLFFFLFLLRVAWEHQKAGGGPSGTPSVEAYCPFGGVESLYQFMTTGGFIRRIEPSALVLLVATLLMTLLFSRGFCGWVCPFGSIQEWLGMLGKKIFRKRFNPTGAWDRRLRYLKYVVLATIVAFTWYLGALVFRPFDPYLAFFHLGNGLSEMPWAYAVLGVVLVGSLRYERFFCKYACPLGAVISLFSKLGITRIVRHPEECKACNACQRQCFAHVDFLSTTTIRDSDCNHCLDCVTTCPKPNVLVVKGATLRFSHATYAALLVAGLATTIGVSKVSGYWRAKPEAVAFTNSAGKLDSEQMRGWMTLKELSTGYGIPLPELYGRAGLPAAVPPSSKINQIARNYNLTFEPEQMREVIRGFLAGEAPKPKPDKKDPGKKKGAGDGEEVRGTMTLNEVSMKTGVPKAFILKSVGAPAGTDPRKPVREWIHDTGKTMQDVRQAVADYRAGQR